MRSFKCFSLLIAFVLLSLSSIHAAQCTIIGEVIGRESKALLMRKCSESARVYMTNPTRILIKDGKFEYAFTTIEEEAYELVFEEELQSGNWIPIIFFPTDGIVKLELHPQNDWWSNKVNGGKLNSEYYDFRSAYQNLFGKPLNDLIAVQDELDRLDELESAEYKEVLKQLRSTKSGDHDALVPIYQKMDVMDKTQDRYTEKAKRLFINPYDSLRKVEFRWRYDHIKNNVTISSYYLVWFDVEMEMAANSMVAQLASEVFPAFEKKYPTHVYTKKVKTQLAGIKTIVLGKKYIDFKAPSVEGDTVQLSTLINNKVALIDLWGSWCGPCIAKSRLVVPIYNKYKNKGFEVVGIAREFETTDAVKKRLAKEEFVWKNLVELDDKLNIWTQYGISNGAGLMLLVDRDGTILSIDPKPEELEKILQEKL